jgi:transposase InsO family protein
VFVSDQGSHFKNRLLSSIADVIGASHHFTLAYVPWSNGTVEVVNREILRVLRALLSGFHMRPSDWPRILPLVQSTLNHSPLEHFKGVAPITAFTGLPPTSSLDSLVDSISLKTFSLSSISDL